MTNIPMPAAALEAGAKVLADINGWRDESGLIACMPVARLCFLAMIEAWEGMSQLAENDSASIREMAAIILPLPTEASDE